MSRIFRKKTPDLNICPQVKPGDVTQILNRIQAGDPQAQSELFTFAFEELHRAASALMHRERANHTLQPSALINEAALRLLGTSAIESIPDRAYFFASMVRAMRRVLIDHARSRNARRRSSDQPVISLDHAIEVMEKNSGVDLIALDESLNALAEKRPRSSQVVELRFFGGMSLPEIADQLTISLATVNREWRYARAWLNDHLDDA
ncbi:RNA polymerase sigma factor SigL [Rubripirellula tenax]|uniref:RNA polymerase sigma factor SigL n=1 Tax=Rubripirellula tenax TaxID=2528015 RepID=A0A5C6FE88_9BACT|nr:ECF-type sigma factor [Rubripirellula tenax]TWU59062.1 RNA polymerase sigma factor SigL [Rubripirellula tenax]